MFALLVGCGDTGPPPAPTAPAKKAAPAPAPGKAPAPAAALPGASAATPAPAPPVKAAFAYESRGRRDPFRPLVVARPPTQRPKTGLASLDPGELKLTGIVWDQRGYYALVEAPNGLGYVIRANDVIGDEARVTRITPEGLTLEVQTRAELPRQTGARRLLEIRLRKEEER